MPIYEYTCASCAHRFEKLVLRSEQQVVCPRCDAPDVKRLISAPNFGSTDGSIRDASATSSSCGSCTATSCSSCSGGS